MKGLVLFLVGLGAVPHALPSAALRPGGEEAPELPARRPEAGMHGFYALSRVHYVQQPELPYLLQVHYQFPARARWKMEAETVEGGWRVIEYRAGDRGFVVNPRSSESFALEDPDFDALVLRMSLRRAAMMWPDTAEWSSVADAGENARYRSQVRRGERVLGTLEARMDERNTAVSFALLDAEDNVREQLEVTGWLRIDGRSWPKGFAFSAQGNPVWNEDLLEIQSNAYFVDMAFVPPDQRSLPATDAPKQSEVRSVDLIPHTYHRFALDPKLSWSKAVKAARAHATAIEADSAETGLVIDTTPTLELDSSGRAVACRVRLRAPLRSAPKEWTQVDERPGLLTPLPTFERLEAELTNLRSKVPTGHEPGTAYVRVYEEAGSVRLELSLPFVRN